MWFEGGGGIYLRVVFIYQKKDGMHVLSRMYMLSVWCWHEQFAYTI